MQPKSNCAGRIEDLRRQLQDLKGQTHAPAHPGPPTKALASFRLTIWALFLVAVVLIVVAFFAGYIPLRKRKTLIAQRGAANRSRLCRAWRSSKWGAPPARANCNCPATSRPSPKLPSSPVPTATSSAAWWTSAIACRPASPLAEIEAPELDQQVRQAKANRAAGPGGAGSGAGQLRAGQVQYGARPRHRRALGQPGPAGRCFAPGERQYQAQYQVADRRSCKALEKAIAVQRSNIAAAEANLARLERCRAIVS